jgi:putative heme-binding domain-containing protein
MNRCHLIACGLLPLLAATAVADNPNPLRTLEQRLLAEDPAALLRAVRKSGDTARGAALYFSPQLGCTKCHSCGPEGAKLGPDLAQIGKEATAAHLVESILEPSRVIKKGFESVTVVLGTGKRLTGLLVENKPDTLVVRDLEQDGKVLTIDQKSIDEWKISSRSIMPEGLINALESRQQFLDLCSFVIEVAAGGAERARQLVPSADSIPKLKVADYENDLDHAGLIAAWNSQSLKRGEAIYDRLCINCHGTKEQPGSLPTSLRFASGAFKNGNDPYRIYQTLTHGFNLMTPQTALVPREKYDVIHFVREAYLKRHNPPQYFKVNAAYLNGLPKGKSKGPDPLLLEPWSAMNFGPSLTGTFEIGNGEGNFAYKGVAVRLDAGPGGVGKGRAWMMFEHDTLRVAAAWSGKGFIDWNGINFNGRHQVHPRLAGTVHVANPVGPGWANPQTDSFDDPRERGRDNKPYGPLPRSWAHYRGAYDGGDRVIFSYTVGATAILEAFGLEFEDVAKGPVFSRTLHIAPAKTRLLARLAPSAKACALVGNTPAVLREADGFTLLEVPAHTEAVTVKVLLADIGREALQTAALKATPAEDLSKRIDGGRKRWPDLIKTPIIQGRDNGPFAVDELTLPEANPWACQTRLTGFDFLPDGKQAAVCTWDGDVWLVSGLEPGSDELTWRRIASGLFQPLGLKVVAGAIYVSCRDQIAILRDRNSDGETDFYENFNSDHQVTEHFHEFAMGLQIDDAGNFYYAKSARHALPAIVPQHGTLLRVSKDGSMTEILAKGFRAANGVCINPDGTFFVTDQEGHWTPKNRINLVKPNSAFFGNMWAYHDIKDASDTAMEQPLCWITNRMDRSPAELLWVDSPAWGALHGSLLNLSYGNGQIYVVPHEIVGGHAQGGVCALPLPPFPTGIMRGRFHPSDGHLYACGMFAWAGNQQQPGGFYRVRTTGKPIDLPIGLKAWQNGVTIAMSDAIDPKSVDVANFSVKTWSLKRSEKYGSDHVGERAERIAAVRLAGDGKTLFLELPDIQPTWCMEINFAVKGAKGEPISGSIHNTIHRLREEAYRIGR